MLHKCVGPSVIVKDRWGGFSQNKFPSKGRSSGQSLQNGCEWGLNMNL